MTDIYADALAGARRLEAESHRIVREQLVRDADYEDVGLAAMHVNYTDGGVN